MKNSRNTWIIIIAVMAVVACICVAVSGVLGGFYYLVSNNTPPASPQEPESEQLPTQPVTRPTTSSAEPTRPETAVPLPTMISSPLAAMDTLKILKDAQVPNNDPRELAGRLKGIQNIPDVVDTPVPNYKVGDQTKFFATNVDTNKNFEVEAVLGAITDNAYIWIEKGVTYNKNDLKRLADVFQNQIYTTNRKFFGSEWTPGIDKDPHIYIIFATNLGGNLAGYFSSTDSVHPLAHPYSNAKEAFFLNADNVSMGEDAYSTLAHEFQHMIHWYRDRNEESWLNEGFSVLAELLNNYDTGGFDWLFTSQPDQQLNDWPNDPNATTPYYGSSFLFVTYFLDRFGEEATQALVADPDNGMDSVETVLEGLNLTDPVTGRTVTADDVFADWVLANYINEKDVEDGRFDYQIYPQAPQTSDTLRINNCPVNLSSGEVRQYGTDYLRFACDGDLTLTFQGAKEVGVLEESPHSGDYYFWSNKGDESDMTLTREFDFTGVTGPVEINFWTWYDLEKDYDYLYLEVSQDGTNWEILTTPSGTDENPSGNSFGWGYNGVTNGWIEERVDLSKFAGKKVQVRFEYVTDAAVNGEGLMLDDITVPALGYSTDFESDDGGWQAAGFVRIQNALPQSYRVSLIKYGRDTTVEYLTLDADQNVSVPLSFGSDLREVTLVISGTTRFTRQAARYQYSLLP